MLNPTGSVSKSYCLTGCQSTLKMRHLLYCRVYSTVFGIKERNGNSALSVSCGYPSTSCKFWQRRNDQILNLLPVPHSNSFISAIVLLIISAFYQQEETYGNEMLRAFGTCARGTSPVNNDLSALRGYNYCTLGTVNFFSSNGSCVHSCQTLYEMAY